MIFFQVEILLRNTSHTLNYDTESSGFVHMCVSSTNEEQLRKHYIMLEKSWTSGMCVVLIRYVWTYLSFVLIIQKEKYSHHIRIPFLIEYVQFFVIVNKNLLWIETYQMEVSATTITSCINNKKNIKTFLNKVDVCKKKCAASLWGFVSAFMKRHSTKHSCLLWQKNKNLLRIPLFKHNTWSSEKKYFKTLLYFYNHLIHLLRRLTM